MRNRKLLAGLVAGLLLVGGAVAYAGMWTGLPAATSSPTTGNAVTLPLTGNEVGAFDTGLTGGRNPQTETISVDQIKTYVYGNGGTAGATGNTVVNAASGSATCNAARCVVMSEPLTTTVGNFYTLVLSSSNIISTSILQVTVGNVTNTATGVSLRTVTTSSSSPGAATIQVVNAPGGTASFNGTLRFSVLIIN